MTKQSPDMHTETTDKAASITDGLQTVSYTANSQGKLEQVKGPGWQPTGDVNRQAWQEIEKQIEQARNRVAAGRASCLYYYMVANQMSILLLARYSRQSPLLVLMHLIPFFFAILSETRLERYAALFQVTPEDLARGDLRPAVYFSSLRHD